MVLGQSWGHEKGLLKANRTKVFVAFASSQTPHTPYGFLAGLTEPHFDLNMFQCLF